MVPSRASSRPRITAGRNRVHMASISTTPAARAAAIMRPAWAAFRARAFSQSTCLPWPRQSRAWSQWKAWGVPM